MNEYEQYDLEKIEIPKTDADFWLALMRVRDHHFPDGFAYINEKNAANGRLCDPIALAWLLLSVHVELAFYECKTE